MRKIGGTKLKVAGAGAAASPIGNSALVLLCNALTLLLFSGVKLSERTETSHPQGKEESNESILTSAHQGIS